MPLYPMPPLPHAGTPGKKKALPKPLNQNTSSHCHEHPNIVHIQTFSLYTFTNSSGQPHCLNAPMHVEERLEAW